MDVVIVVGPQAVGKMTVGEELEKRTELKLLHNHMTIDLVLKFMPWEDGIDLIRSMRDEIMKRVAKGSSLGMIITFIWAFNQKEDWEYVEKIRTIFKEHDIYYVELNSDVDTRLKRNVTENRLKKKWTKRDTKRSNGELIASMDKHRMISNDNEVPYKNYIRIDNTNLSPIETSNMIIKHFNLKTLI